MSDYVRVVKRGRGLYTYGARPIRCTYGSEIEVYDSSSAEGPHVWLRIAGLDQIASAHLNEKQVKKLVNRLRTWLDYQGVKR